MAHDVKQQNNNSEQVIRLDDIIYILTKHHKAMIGFAAIGLIVGMLVSFALYVKGLTTIKYYVTASIAVTSTNQDGLFSANSSDPNATDIHLAEDMTDAVIYVCKSDTTLNAAAERLQLIGVSAEDIKPNLMLSQYEKTQIIEMTLIWDNSEEGILILNAITDVVPSILIDTLKIGDVSIVNPPKVRTTSLSFINVKVIAICFLLGLIASAGYYLVRHFIHPTYLHSEDVKEAYDLDILGEIPGDKNYFSAKINSFNPGVFSSVQEYFSACAHVLVYRLQDFNNVCVYITSSASQEGKSSITANLGYALAELGYKTLIMDMDVRNPSLASKFIFAKDDYHCLNAVYRGEIPVSEAVVRINSCLDILPTKLEDERLKLDNTMVEIISSAKEDYDFVIIDTAPVGQVSDSMNLNQAADCAIFVVRQDQVWINTVTESINRLRKSGIAILGAIMNDTKGGSNSYYYYNYKQFGDSPYNYGNKPNKKNRREKRVEEESSSNQDKVGLAIMTKRNRNKSIAEAEAQKLKEEVKEEVKEEIPEEKVNEEVISEEPKIDDIKTSDDVEEVNKDISSEDASSDKEESSDKDE